MKHKQNEIQIRIELDKNILKLGKYSHRETIDFREKSFKGKYISQGIVKPTKQSNYENRRDTNLHLFCVDLLTNLIQKYYT